MTIVVVASLSLVPVLAWTARPARSAMNCSSAVDGQGFAVDRVGVPGLRGLAPDRVTRHGPPGARARRRRSLRSSPQFPRQRADQGTGLRCWLRRLPLVMEAPPHVSRTEQERRMLPR